MDAVYGEFIVNILETLHKNGFPEKKVSLPLEKMYEIAHHKGLNFNKVLDFLREKSVDHEKTTEKLIFFPMESPKVDERADQSDDPSDFLLKGLSDADLNFSDILTMGKELLEKMPKEQIQAGMKMFSEMSPEQKNDLLKRFTPSK